MHLVLPRTMNSGKKYPYGKYNNNNILIKNDQIMCVYHEDYGQFFSFVFVLCLSVVCLFVNQKDQKKKQNNNKG